MNGMENYGQSAELVMRDCCKWESEEAPITARRRIPYVLLVAGWPLAAAFASATAVVAVAVAFEAPIGE